MPPLLFVLLKAVNIFSRTWKVLQVKGQEALEKQGQEKKNKSHQAQVGPVLTGRSGPPNPRLWLRVDRCPLVFPPRKSRAPDSLT